MLEIVPSAPFDGAAAYLACLPLMWQRNLPVVLRALRGEHIVWIKVPGSNGPLAAYACAALGIPRFTYVVGNVGEVVAASGRRGLTRFGATAAAALHDGVTRMLAISGPSIRLGPDIFSSAITAADLEVFASAFDAPEQRAATATSAGSGGRDRPARLAWAGRVAPEKGLDELLEAATLLVALGRSIELMLIGDGPERPRLEARTRTLGMTDHVRWLGHVAVRAAYLQALGDADLFVLPSRTEGVPKALVEAMGLGLPAVATGVGGIPAIAAGGDRLRIAPVGDAIALSTVIAALLDEPAAAGELGARGAAWARDHTAEAQAERLVEWMRQAFPSLPWHGRGGSA